MFNKTSLKCAIVAATTILIGGCASNSSNAGDSDKAGVDYTKMTPEALAEYLIFEAGGFKTDMPTQEGRPAGERLVQDELQKLCSTERSGPVDAETSTKVLKMANESIVLPEGGIKLGDWEIGRELAWSGFGWRVGHRNDNHAEAPHGAGGNCYNCHQMATDRTGGTIGPPLTGYGARGTSQPILEYTYRVIYNPHSYFACTNMPRMGEKGLLTAEQISHIMAYLMDPESPVNKDL
jgi:L-cysteine S-thiosulfotransferase